MAKIYFQTMAKYTFLERLKTRDYGNMEYFVPQNCFVT